MLQHALRQALKTGLETITPRRLFMVRGPRRQNSICLTYDDGPHDVHTPRLLDTLGNLSIKATFFVIGEQAERHPAIIRRMAAEGHTVGTHTYFHRDPAQTSARQLLSETERTCALISDLLGTPPPTLFRPPHGKLTPAKFLALWRMSQTVVLWNVDPKDFARQNTAEVRTWFSERVPRSGDLVLMHDNLPHAAEVLPDLAASAHERGLTFSTINDWVT